MPLVYCPGDLANRNTAAMSSYDYNGTSYAQNQATENTTNVNYQYTLLERGNVRE